MKSIKTGHHRGCRTAPHRHCKRIPARMLNGRSGSLHAPTQSVFNEIFNGGVAVNYISIRHKDCRLDAYKKEYRTGHPIYFFEKPPYR